jgi:uncharacterized protein YegL
MNHNLTDLNIIVDRSGSMITCQGQAESGINGLIADQKGQEGDCNFTLVEFDNEIDVVQNCVPISRATSYSLVPRGGTALLDAIGSTISRIGSRLAKMNEKDRPALVIVAIVTDGKEWASKEYSLSQIKSMISRQSSDYQWQFTFLGADASAFAEAASMGIQSAAVYNTASADAAFKGVSGNTSRMRSQSLTKSAVVNEYTGSELRAMNE